MENSLKTHGIPMEFHYNNLVDTLITNEVKKQSSPSHTFFPCNSISYGKKRFKMFPRFFARWKRRRSGRGRWGGRSASPRRTQWLPCWRPAERPASSPHCPSPPACRVGIYSIYKVRRTQCVGDLETCRACPSPPACRALCRVGAVKA